MRLTTWSAIPALILSLSSLAAAAEPTAAVRSGSEQLLPKHTLAFVRIPSARTFRQKWNDSSFGTMQNDPKFRGFFADIERQIAELTLGVQQTAGLSLKELWLSLEGEISLAVVNRPEADWGLALVAVVDAGKDDEAAGHFVRQLEQKLSKAGGVDATVKSGKLEISSWSLGSANARKKFSYFRQGTKLLVSNDLNAVLEIAGHRNGSGRGDPESFSSNSVYRQVVSQTRPEQGEAAAEWYVDPLGLLQAAISANLRGNPNQQLLTGLLPATGLDKFRAIGGSVDLGGEGVDSTTRTFGYLDGPAEGLLEAFKMPATRQRPPDWVKDDVNLYAQINWSVPRFYQTLGGFVDKFQGAGSFNSLIGSARLGDTEYSYKDLMQQFVGPLHIAAQMPASTADLLKQPAVVAFGVRDPREIQKMLQALAKSASLKPTAVGNASLYKMSFPSPLGGQEFQFGAAVAEGSLMLSTNAGYLQSVLANRHTKRPLAESRAYRQATEHFPQQTSMISFQNQDRRFEGLYEQIRSGKLELPLYGGIMSGLGLDFSKLPPFEAMSRYLQTSAGYIEPTDKGFRMIDIGQAPREH